MSDSVNEYGLGAPESQDQPMPPVPETPGPDPLVHGLGPSDGPFEGEAAPEEEGTRFGLGDDDTQPEPPGPETTGPDPLEHGLGPAGG